MRARRDRHQSGPPVARMARCHLPAGISGPRHSRPIWCCCAQRLPVSPELKSARLCCSDPHLTVERRCLLRCPVQSGRSSGAPFQALHRRRSGPLHARDYRRLAGWKRILPWAILAARRIRSASFRILQSFSRIRCSAFPGTGTGAHAVHCHDRRPTGRSCMCCCHETAVAKRVCRQHDRPFADRRKAAGRGARGTGSRHGGVAPGTAACARLGPRCRCPRRGQLLRTFGDPSRRHRQPLARLVMLETGKVAAEALGEVQENSRHARFGHRPVAPAARPRDRVLAARAQDAGKLASVRHLRRAQRVQRSCCGLGLERRAGAGLRSSRISSTSRNCGSAGRSRRRALHSLTRS